MAKVLSSPILQMIRGVAQDKRLRRLSDGDLVTRFVETKDEQAFDALVRRHGPMVLDVCHGVLGNEADVEDAFQASFLILARKATSIRKTASIGSWLHGVAYRTARKAKAKSATRKKYESRVAVQQAGELADLSWREVRSVLHEELTALAERYRAPLVACYLEGMIQDEAAEQLGIATSTLKERLERGRALLRARLVRRGLGPVAALLVAAWPLSKASACLPGQLVSNTIRAAGLFAAGKAAPTPLISEAVVALAEGVLKSMFLTKIKVAIVSVTLATLVLFSTGFMIHAVGATAQDEAAKKKVDDAGLPKKNDERNANPKAPSPKADPIDKANPKDDPIDAAPAWGEVVDGLQLAVTGIQKDKRFKVGDTIRYGLSVRNVGAQAVNIQYTISHTHYWMPPQVETDMGQSVKILKTIFRGAPALHTETLQPNGVASIRIGGILVVGTSDTAQKHWPRIENPAPGAYRLRTVYNISRLDGKGKPIGQPTWLTTGTVPFRIESPADASAKPKKDVGALLGKWMAENIAVTGNPTETRGTGKVLSKGMWMSLEDGKMVRPVSGPDGKPELRTYKFTLDTDKNPPRLTLHTKTHVLRYIYEVKGDTLRMCCFDLAEVDGVELVAWPTKFSLADDRDKLPRLEVWKRVKDEPKEVPAPVESPIKLKVIGPAKPVVAGEDIALEVVLSTDGDKNYNVPLAAFPQLFGIYVAGPAGKIGPDLTKIRPENWMQQQYVGSAEEITVAKGSPYCTTVKLKDYFKIDDPDAFKPGEYQVNVKFLAKAFQMAAPIDSGAVKFEIVNSPLKLKVIGPVKPVVAGEDIALDVILSTDGEQKHTFDLGAFPQVFGIYVSGGSGGSVTPDLTKIRPENWMHGDHSSAARITVAKGSPYRTTVKLKDYFRIADPNVFKPGVYQLNVKFRSRDLQMAAPIDSGAVRFEIVDKSPLKLKVVGPTKTVVAGEDIPLEVVLSTDGAENQTFRLGAFPQVFGIYVSGPSGAVTPDLTKIRPENWMHQKHSSAADITVSKGSPFRATVNLSDYFRITDANEFKEGVYQVNVKFFANALRMAAPIDSGPLRFELVNKKTLPREP